MSSRSLSVPLSISLAVVLVALASGCGSMRAFVYFPQKDDGAERAPDWLDPRGPAVEDVRFTSEDGTRLHGWLARRPGASVAVLVCHGNAGNVEQRGDEVVRLRQELRVHVLELDYRGYGRSEGSPDEAGVCADARAALAALERETGVPHARTVVVGHSLGGAVAIDLASNVPDLGALVVLASFTSIDDMVESVVGFPGLGWLIPERFDSISKVGSIACPKFFVHGDADRVVPYQHGRRLFEAACQPKHFFRATGEGHELVESAVWLSLIGRGNGGYVPSSEPAALVALRDAVSTAGGRP